MYGSQLMMTADEYRLRCAIYYTASLEEVTALLTGRITYNGVIRPAGAQLGLYCLTIKMMKVNSYY